MAPVWAPLALVETFIPVEVPVAYTETSSSEWTCIRVTGTDIGRGTSEVLNGVEAWECRFGVGVATETESVLESLEVVGSFKSGSFVRDASTESEVDFVEDTHDGYVVVGYGSGRAINGSVVASSSSVCFHGERVLMPFELFEVNTEAFLHLSVGGFPADAVSSGHAKFVVVVLGLVSLDNWGVLVEGSGTVMWLQPGGVCGGERWYKSFKSEEFAFTVEPVSTIWDWSWVVEFDRIGIGTSV